MPKPLSVLVEAISGKRSTTDGDQDGQKGRHQIATWRDEGRRGDRRARDRGRRDLPRARHVTSRHAHITSHHTHHITSHHITSHHITSHHITSHHITRAHIATDAAAHTFLSREHTQHTATTLSTQHSTSTHTLCLVSFLAVGCFVPQIVLTPRDTFPVLCHDLC